MMKPAAALFGRIKSDRNIKSDAALARMLEVDPPVISRARAGIHAIGDMMIVSIHEETGMPIREIKGVLGLRCLDKWEVIH